VGLAPRAKFFRAPPESKIAMHLARQVLNGKTNLTAEEIEKVFTLADFPHLGTRELTAADYVYQIKRLAHPRLHSPIFGLMTEYIVGLKEFGKTLAEANKKLITEQGEQAFLDLNQFELSGVQVIDRYTYRIKIKGKYPQFLFWLAMPFFAPIPSEADQFYSQPG